MALPQEQRLRSSRLIQTILKKGVKKQTPYFRVFILPAQSGKNQAAIVVSSKTESVAVRRNKIKRRIGEGIRTVLAETGNIPSQLFVFLAFPSVLDVPFPELQNEIRRIVKT